MLARRDEAFELFGGEWSLRARLFVAARTAAHPFAGALLLAGVAALVVADQLEPSDEWPSVLTPAALRAVTVVGAVMVLGNLYYAVDAAFLDGDLPFSTRNATARAGAIVTALAGVLPAAGAVYLADRVLDDAAHAAAGD